MALYILLSTVFYHPTGTGCTIDLCEGDTCLVETPEGFVHVPYKMGMYEGQHTSCPLYLIDPT